MRSLFLLAAAFLALTAVAAEEEKKIVCYFGSWAVYRPSEGKFAIEDIDANLCTHAIYTFVGLGGDSSVKVLDAWQDLPDNWGKDGFGRFNALRKQNPKLKTMVAIGGWNEGSSKYSSMAKDPAARSRFVKNVVDFVKKHNFDGFDVDWEYPAQRGGIEDDVDNYVELLKELRAELEKDGLLLSAAVGAAESSASKSYKIAEISKHLNFINLMTYDLHGSWEPKTGINAPLRPAKSESGNELQLNVEAAVKFWIDHGADRKKIVVGTASYGRSFTLANPNAAKVGDATRGPGAAGRYTREAGMLGYNEICELQNEQEWTVQFDEERRVPFAYSGDQWVGYDNVKSIKEKAEFIKEMGLGGAMMWSIETDDFKGNCGEKYPLLKTLQHVLRGGPAVSERPPQPHKPTQAPTTEKTPQQPGNGGSGNGQCTKAGDMADPTTCKQFIKCVDQGNGQFQAVVMQCAPGLCFKPSTGICDWA